MSTPHPLAEYRARAGLAQKDLAEAVGTSRWTIAMIEAGLRNPSARLVRALVAETGIPRERLRPDLYEAAQPCDFPEGCADRSHSTDAP